MSGWTKWEKDLETDPRMIRLMREVKRRSVTPALHERLLLTLTCGALLRLWSYADSHIRTDDTIDLGVADINDLVGIDGFAESLPEDWIRVIDEKTVELPGFQAHNGVTAKKKALTQKRVERHRREQCNADVTPERYTSVATALPDQTRPRPRPSKRAMSAPPIPENVNPVAFKLWIEYRRESGKSIKLVSYPALFEKFSKLGDHSAQLAAAKHSIASTYTGIYAERPSINGKGPAPPPSNEAAWAEAKAAAQEIGFRPPLAHESVTSYAYQVKRAKDAPPRRTPVDLKPLIDKLRITS